MRLPGFTAEATVCGLRRSYSRVASRAIPGAQAVVPSDVSSPPVPPGVLTVPPPTCDQLAPWPGLTMCGTAYQICMSNPNNPWGCCDWWSQNCQGSSGGGAGVGGGGGGRGGGHQVE
jgi:hypothetical protein